MSLAGYYYFKKDEKIYENETLFGYKDLGDARFLASHITPGIFIKSLTEDMTKIELSCEMFVDFYENYYEALEYMHDYHGIDVVNRINNPLESEGRYPISIRLEEGHIIFDNILHTDTPRVIYEDKETIKKGEKLDELIHIEKIKRNIYNMPIKNKWFGKYIRIEQLDFLYYLIKEQEK